MAENASIPKQNGENQGVPEPSEEKSDVVAHKFTIGSVTVLTFILGLQIAGVYNWITSQPRQHYLHKWCENRKKSKVTPEVKDDDEADKVSNVTQEDHSGDEV